MVLGVIMYKRYRNYELRRSRNSSRKTKKTSRCRSVTPARSRKLPTTSLTRLLSSPSSPNSTTTPAKDCSTKPAATRPKNYDLVWQFVVGSHRSGIDPCTGLLGQGSPWASAGSAFSLSCYQCESKNRLELRVNTTKSLYYSNNFDPISI